jgi:cytochrome P450
MVLSEVLRLYPPAYVMGRRVVEEHRIAGYRIPVDSTIVMSQYVTHHDARWFPEPFRFDPERWTDEAKASRPRYSYFPFGGGPRMCIGEGFAWMEAELLLATLAQRWRMRVPESHLVELQPMITLRPKGGMPVRLERRS